MVDAVSAAMNLQNSAANSRASLTNNFDTFLTLLTAQLQNQDPLAPVDSTEFTNQLVQFSGVEQQIETNTALSNLIAITASSTAASMSGYLGQTVEVYSATGELSENGIDWLYDLPEGVKSVTISIKDDAGAIVYSETVDAPTIGKNEFSWDGTLENGTVLEDGTYSLLIGATDGNDQEVSVAPTLRTKVSGIDLSSGSAALATDAGVFYFSSILRLMSAN